MQEESLGGIRDVDTTGAHVIPVVAFKKAWWMAGQHGVTMELRHCVMTEPPTANYDWPIGGGTTADENLRDPALFRGQATLENPRFRRPSRRPPGSSQDRLGSLRHREAAPPKAIGGWWG